MSYLDSRMHLAKLDDFTKNENPGTSEDRHQRQLSEPKRVYRARENLKSMVRIYQTVHLTLIILSSLTCNTGNIRIGDVTK